MAKQDVEAFESFCRQRRRTIACDDYIVCSTILGDEKIFFDANDTSLVPRFLEYGCWEPGVSVFLSKLLKDKTVFVDVGANFGYFCVLAVKAIGDKCTIHAFEANPKLATLLKRSFRTFYPHIRITIHPQAAASTSGVCAYLNTRGTLMGGSWITKEPPPGVSTLQVSTVALDDVLPKKVDFMKIDAEGSERDIWHGMRRILARNRNLSIAMEFYCGYEYDPPVFLQEIRSDGFAIGKINSSGDCRLVRDDELLASREFQMLYLFRGWQYAPSKWAYFLHAFDRLWHRRTAASKVASFYWERAKAFDTERMYERAIADYTRVLSSPSRQSDNFHASVYFRRGNAQEKLQQLGPALDDYRQAAALNPRCRDAANALKRLVAALPDGCAVRTHSRASETILSSPSNAPHILRVLSTLRWNILRSKEARKPKRFVDE